jgi:hypothetical protein
MLHNLLNQTAEIFNVTYPDPDPDNYGIVEATYVSQGLFACRVIPWPGKDVEYAFDRETRRSLIRIILEETAAPVLQGTSHIQLSTQSIHGQIADSTIVGQDSTETIYDIQGDPQVFYRRSAISHVEAIMRAIEG